MAYPPQLPPTTRTDSTLSAVNHARDHNLTAVALRDLVLELGASPAGPYANLTDRLLGVAVGEDQAALDAFTEARNLIASARDEAIEARDVAALIALGDADAALSAAIANPESLSGASLNTLLDTRAPRPLTLFGAKGDGATDDTTALRAALAWSAANGGRTVAGTPGAAYAIRTAGELVDAGSGGRVDLDLRGGRLRFFDTGGLNVGRSTTPASTVNVTADVRRGGTFITVADASGIAKGDLIVVKSPVEWVAGIELSQTYLVSDVDGNNVHVEGRIVGDMTAAMTTAASKTGPLTVAVHKVADYFGLRNAILEAPTKGGAATMLMVRGFRQFRIENVDVVNPNRMGIYTHLCGSGTVVNSTTRDHGYVTKDEGYANIPSAPGGLGFGYGFIAAYCGTVHYNGCHSFSGWHGFDVARGTSVAVFNDCVVHKDAFGISSHEGVWDLRVTGCQFLGGLGITNRGNELTVTGCTFSTSGSGITSGTPGRLTVKGNIFDHGGTTITTVVSIYCTEVRPAYTREATGDPLLTIIEDNTFISAATCYSLPGGHAGTVIIKGNTYRRVVTAGGGVGAGYAKAIITNNTFTDVKTTDNLQAMFTVGAAQLIASGNVGDTNAAISNKALIYYTPPAAGGTVLLTNNTLQGADNLIRVMGTNAVALTVIANVIPDGRLVLANGATTTLRSVGNLYKNANSGTPTVAQDTGNVALAA